MKKLSLFFLMLASSFIISSCKDYVTHIDPLIDAVEDGKLDTPNQIPFLIKGVQTRFAFTNCQVMVCADGLSDAFFFDSHVPNATYPTFEDIDNGDIQYDNNSVDNAYTPLGQYRFYADDLIRRTNSLNVGDAALKNEALFTGYFYGGYARYLYAVYFGLNQNEGGAPIDNGPFIPSSQMFDQAIEKFNTALTYTTDAYTIRMVNSVIARAYLYKGDYGSAANFAAKGLVNGDEPLQALHNLQQDNFWWQQAGDLRAQFVADWRFKDYIDADPNEANRIKLEIRKGSNDVDYYYQVINPTADSPENCITWQENNLMRAELILRGNASGDALGLVNEVRSSHGIAPLSAVDLDVLLTERDKELFTTGARLPDQRRFDKWHLSSTAWHYLPVTQSERNNNPNL